MLFDTNCTHEMGYFVIFDVVMMACSRIFKLMRQLSNVVCRASNLVCLCECECVRVLLLICFCSFSGKRRVIRALDYTQLSLS